MTTILPNQKIKAEEKSDHPAHYGGETNPYEAIKVIDAWDANFNLGNVIKYLCRVCVNYKYLGQMDSPEAIKKVVEDLKKARTYIDFEIKKIEK